jgi:hypothetical protein
VTTTTPGDEPGHLDVPASDAYGQQAESNSADDSGQSDSVVGGEVIDGELSDDPKVERIANLVVARVENKLEQHLHTQMELPSADQAAELREKAPELYQAWIDIARQKADTESYVQRAQYEVPSTLARTGRPWALGALFLVLGLCGYIASLGGAGLYIAGILAAIDLISMLGLFMGMRPELESSGEKEKRKRLEGSDPAQSSPDKSADSE